MKHRRRASHPPSMRSILAKYTRALPDLFHFQRYKMLDYLKMWIFDLKIIKYILQDERIKFESTYDECDNLLRKEGKFLYWSFLYLPNVCRLQISGSIHRYWNQGTNENDFSITNVVKAIEMFCIEFNLDPLLVHIKNMEVGVNVRPAIPASSIMEQVLCFNYRLPTEPYVAGNYFMEFKQTQMYVKLYDKGAALKQIDPLAGNILRFEIKLMKSRYFRQFGIETLMDLLDPAKLVPLGPYLFQFGSKLIFDDNTINEGDLSFRDRRIYRQLNNPRKWPELKGKTNSSTWNNVTRFKAIVNIHGQRKIYDYFNEIIVSKVRELTRG